MGRGDFVFCSRCYEDDGRTDMWTFASKLQKSPEGTCRGCGTKFKNMQGADRILDRAAAGGGGSRGKQPPPRKPQPRGRSATRRRFPGWNNEWDHKHNKPKGRHGSRSKYVVKPENVVECGNHNVWLYRCSTLQYSAVQ